MHTLDPSGLAVSVHQSGVFHRSACKDGFQVDGVLRLFLLHGLAHEPVRPYDDSPSGGATVFDPRTHFCGIKCTIYNHNCIKCVCSRKDGTADGMDPSFGPT